MWVPRCGSVPDARRLQRPPDLLRSLGGLPAAPAEQHHRDRAQHDPQILGCRLAPNVLEIEGDLAPYVVDRAVVSLVHLGPPGDAGAHPLTALVSLDLLAQVNKDRGLLRPGADDVHVPAQHVEELGQFVEPQLAQYPANGRYPRVVWLGPDLVLAPSRRDIHRAELVHRERLAALVEAAARVAASA